MKKRMMAVIGAVIFCGMITFQSWAGDNGDGTVTVGNLVWLKDAGCLGEMSNPDAVSRVASLANGQCRLTDNSRAGQWRLPNIEELKSIYSAKGSFSNVNPDYWSSSCSRTHCRSVDMDTGWKFIDWKYHKKYIWPVRSIQ